MVICQVFNDAKCTFWLLVVAAAAAAAAANWIRAFHFHHRNRK